MSKMIATVVTLCLVLSAADAARTLRQYTDSYTGISTDKSDQVAALTPLAEARSTANTVGVAHAELSVASVATDTGAWRPASQSRASTTVQSGAGQADVTTNTGPAAEVPAALFRTAAVSTTPYGWTAVSAVDAMPQAAPLGTPGTSRGTTTNTYNPWSFKGKNNVESQVQTASIGANLLPANSFGNSGQGDGPNAIAIAGQATSSSFASKSNPNDPIADKFIRV